MQNTINKARKYIDTYITNVRWLRSLIIPALVALVGYNFFEIKTYQIVGEITKKVEDGDSKIKASALFIFFFIVGYTLCLFYEFFYAYFVSISIRSGLTNFFGEYLKIDYKSFHSFGIGEAQFTINRRVYALIEFLSSICIDFISNLLFFLIAFGSLGNEIKSTKLKLIVLASICIFLFFSIIIQYLRSGARYKLNISYEISSRKMYDILYNYERIISYDNLDLELEKYKRSMDSQILWGGIFWVSFEIVSYINSLFFLFINQYMMGTLGVSKNENLDLKAFTLVFNKTKDEVLGMIESVDQVTNNFVNLDQSKIDECQLDEKNESADISIQKIDIVAENLSFAYGERPILKNLNLHISNGEKVAIAGVNGSGKSTFTKLLLGLYDYEGSLKIDGIEYKNIKKKKIREAIAYVSQNAYLFDNSIIDNLKFSDKSISDEKVIEFCKTYNTHELFKTLGYNKRVGEKGKFLSGGQKQKICFMRAVIKNSPAIVLDEATSNMDEYSEYQIIKAITEQMVSKTIVMIIHNLSLIHHFDKIIFFDEQNKIEEGTFDELLNAKNGRFSEFYHRSVESKHQSEE